jgi:hypothetical protein
MVVLMMAWGATPAHAAPGCQVAALVGSAQADGQAVAVGQALREGMTLQTGPDARVRLRCDDGSSLVMAAGTRLRLEVLALEGTQRQNLRWHLGLGLIGQQVAPGGGWMVRTPTAVTAVRGTAFTVEVSGDNAETAVLTQSGAVSVEPAPPITRSATGALSGSVGAVAAVALVAQQGTDCRAGRCSPAMPWGDARVQRTLDRLSGL